MGAQANLTCSLLSGLITLTVEDAGVTSVVGAQNLTGLSSLDLNLNLIADAGPLGRLTFLSLGNNPTLGDISELGDLVALTELHAYYASISDISVLSGFTALTKLRVGGNSVIDIGALRGLISLDTLDLHTNLITDVSALTGLTNLKWLHLGFNPGLADIQPLLDNTGLSGPGDRVLLQSTIVNCVAVTALVAKGVSVNSDCP
jgi:Leucine-rich repeat (LRR) protein